MLYDEFKMKGRFKMKFFKKFAAVLIAMAVFTVGNIGILPRDAVEDFMLSVSAADTDIVALGECGADGDNLTWTLDSEGTLTISGEGEMADWGLNSKLPWGDCDFTKVIIKEGVTSIGTYAFRSCDNLNYITIPYSVTSIGDINNGALFGCQNLMFINVDINNKYYATEDDVLFNKNKTLLIQYPTGKTEEEYVIPDSVTSIGTDAFHFCKSLTSITIPDSVTSIGSFAFSFCNNLTSITIPDSVASIGREAFYYCGNLTSVTASGEINKIGYNTFTGTPWLREKRKENPLVILGRTLIDGQTCEGNVVIPDSVTNIGDYAFDKCDSLTSITILDSVTSIGKEAFYYCENLDSVTIPDSVTGIGYRAFLGCKSLTDIYYNGTEEEWNAITIESGNERLYDSDVTIHYNSKIPDSEKQSEYQFFNMPLSWERAKEYCESLNGHLAVISSAEEQAIIEAQIPNISKNCYWIGAYLENDEWKWVTDEPFEYENWGENLPDNYHGIEKYAHIYAKDNTNESPARLKGEWNDCGYIDPTTSLYNFYSNHNFGFICEWENESLVHDDSETDSKIYGYLDILEWNPFYFGSTDTIEILHEYKEMAKADPQVETYHFWKNLSNYIDGDVNEDEYNEKMTVEAILAEIFLNKELNDAFTKSAEQSAIEAQNMFLTVLADNAESFGIGEEYIGYIESISSSTNVLLDNKKIVSVLESVKPEKVPELFNKLGEYTKKFGKLSDAIGFFQICYEGYNEGVESAAQLYNLYIACVSYHISNMEFRKAVSLMSASVEEEIAKYTGNDDFSHRMRRVGKLYLDYYTVMLDESMAAYDDFASSITSNTLLGTGTELFVFSIKAIVTNVFPALTAAELVLDIGVSIWESTSEIDERSLERDKLLNMILFYDSFSNALYSENGFYGMLKENPTEESYKTLVIGIKMHTITENMLIDYAINYSHMLKRALSDWKRQFALISHTDYVKPVFKARYPQVNVKGETVTRCWRTLNQDMCDDDIQLLKLKKVYIDNDGFDSIKNICNLDETEAQKLSLNDYFRYNELNYSLELYTIFCPVNITVKNDNKIVAKIENDVITYDSGEVFISIYKESNNENAYKYIKLPEGYSLEIIGYDDGEMSFEKAIIENDSVIELSNIEEIPVTAGSVYNEVIEGNKTVALECDFDNDGIVDQTVNAIEEVDAMLGDVNDDGMVDSSDASLVLAEYAKIQTGGAGEFTDIQYKAADVNKDDVVDSSDASKILSYYAMVSTGKEPTWD